MSSRFGYSRLFYGIERVIDTVVRVYRRIVRFIIVSTVLVYLFFVSTVEILFVFSFLVFGTVFGTVLAFEEYLWKERRRVK